MRTFYLVVDSLRYDALYNGHVDTPNIDWLKKHGVNYHAAYTRESCTRDSVPHILSPDLFRELSLRGIKSSVITHNVHVKLHLLREKIDALKTHETIDLDIHGAESGLHAELMIKYSRLKSAFYYFLLGKHRPWTRAPRHNQTALTRNEGFTCLWYMDVHVPYYPPNMVRDGLLLHRLNLRRLNARNIQSSLKQEYDFTEDEINRLRRLYEGEIEYLDRYLGDLLNHLDMEDTRIILTADHGEEFMEYGDTGHQAKKYVEPLLHVPLIIYTPENTKQDIHRFYDIAHIDYTILDLITN